MKKQLFGAMLVFAFTGHSFGQKNAIFNFDNNYEDATGNGYTAEEAMYDSTAANTLSFVTDDVRGVVVDFGADRNTLLRVPDHPGWEGSAARSISAWVKTTNPEGTIVSMGEKGAQKKFVFVTTTEAGFRFEVEGGGIQTAPTTVADGNWHHVALSYPEGSNLTGAEVYLDAVKVAWAGSHNAVPNTAAGSVSIGLDVLPYGRVDPWRAYIGRMDDVMLFDKALTAAEVLDLYNSGLPTSVVEKAVMDDVFVSTGSKSITVSNKGDNAAIMIYNLGGSLLNSVSNMSGIKEFAVTHPGLYLVTIQRDGEMMTKKAIVSK